MLHDERANFTRHFCTWVVWSKFRIYSHNSLCWYIQGTQIHNRTQNFCAWSQGSSAVSLARSYSAFEVLSSALFSPSSLYFTHKNHLLRRCRRFATYVFISCTLARKQMSASQPLVFVCELQKRKRSYFFTSKRKGSALPLTLYYSIR